VRLRSQLVSSAEPRFRIGSRDGEAYGRKGKDKKIQEASGMTVLADEGDGIVEKRIIYLERKISGPRLGRRAAVTEN
jgi:hypothetical protein